jgi:hypothetical protein
MVTLAVVSGVLLVTSCLLIRGKVSGRVLVEGPGGENVPMTAVGVELVDGNGNRIDTAMSDMNGNFMFEKRVRAGTYKCRTLPGGAMAGGGPPAETVVKVFKSRATCQVIIRFQNPPTQ